jgi:hypothetical protein
MAMTLLDLLRLGSMPPPVTGALFSYMGDGPAAGQSPDQQDRDRAWKDGQRGYESPSSHGYDSEAQMRGHQGALERRDIQRAKARKRHNLPYYPDDYRDGRGRGQRA